MKFFTFIVFLLGPFYLLSQCDYYGYSIEIEKVDCSSDIYNICILTDADMSYPVPECAQYDMFISFPSSGFSLISTDPQVTVFQNPSSPNTILQLDLLLFYDYTGRVCFTGKLNSPNTVFSFDIQNPQTNHVVETGSFQLDNHKVIGTNSSSITSVSQAIQNGDLLPYSQATSTPQKIELNGTLLVDMDYVINGVIYGERSNIIMNEDANVTVQTGNSLTLEKTDIAGCDNTWDRILIEPNAVVDVRDASLNGADVGFELEDNAELTAVLMEIKDCTTGILSQGSTLKDIKLNIFGNASSQSQISDCIKGISLENVKLFECYAVLNLNGNGIGIELNQTPFIGHHLRFANNANGVVNSSTSLLHVMENCIFEDNDHAALIKDIRYTRINSCDFFENGFGIEKFSGSNVESVIVTNSTFTLNNQAIGAYLNYSFGNINGNTFMRNRVLSMDFNGLIGVQNWTTSSNTDNLSRHMFNFNNMTDTKTSENIGTTVSALNLVGGANNLFSENEQVYGSYGYKVTSSPLATLECNDLTGRNNINILGNCAGSEIKANTMTNNSGFNLEYGTTFTTFANTGLQPYADNSFDPSAPSNVKAKNHSQSFVSDQNKYLVPNSETQGSAKYPYFEANINNWFFADNGSPDVDCGVDMPEVGEEELTKAMDNEKYLLDNDLKGLYGAEKAFEVGYHLAYHNKWYNTLYGTPPNNYLASIPYQEAIDLAEASFSINQFLNDASYASLAGSFDQNLTSVLNQVYAFVDTVYNQGSNINIYETVPMSSWRSEMLSLAEQYDSNFLTPENNFLTELAVIKNSINSISTVTSAGSYVKEALIYAIDYYSTGYLSSRNIDDVKTLADKCIYDYPISTSLARSLYKMSSGISGHTFNNDCGNTTPRSKELSGNAELAVYPNPAVNGIYINGFSGKVYLKNSSGALLSTIEVGKDGYVDISDLTSGFYFIMDDQGHYAKFIKLD